MGERDFSRFRDFSEDFCRGTVHGRVYDVEIFPAV